MLKKKAIVLTLFFIARLMGEKEFCNAYSIHQINN